MTASKKLFARLAPPPDRYRIPNVYLYKTYSKNRIYFFYIFLSLNKSLETCLIMILRQGRSRDVKIIVQHAGFHKCV